MTDSAHSWEPASELPSYDELPAAASGGRSAWGLFPPSDSVGLMRFVTPEVTLRASSLIRSGQVFALDLPLGFYDPPLFERPPLRVETRVGRNALGLDENYQDFNPQAGSQWDALSHVAYDTDTFFAGATLDDVLTRGRAGISHWAERGLATRGVLLDLARGASAAGRPFDPGSPYAFTVDDLEAARLAAGIEFRLGDVIVVRTGFTDWYRGLDPDERSVIADRTRLTAAGVEHTEAMARYLWNSHGVGIASDSPSVEVWPMDHSAEAHPFGVLHRMLLGQFGMAIGELWNLDPLAEWCAANGQYEFFLSSAPLHTVGGVGSPASALAIV